MGESEERRGKESEKSGRRKYNEEIKRENGERK